MVKRYARAKQRSGYVAGICTLLLVAIVSTAPAHADVWTKIDCASAAAHLAPPAGMQADCYQGPSDRGGTVTCEYFRYSATAAAGSSVPHFYMQLRKSPNLRCSLEVFTDPAKQMMHAAKFVEDEAVNWTAVQRIDSDTQIMFFDAKNQKRDGKCFAFTKVGPLTGPSGRAYTLYGYFCKAPGQPIDAAAAAAMIKGIQIRP